MTSINIDYVLTGWFILKCFLIGSGIAFWILYTTSYIINKMISYGLKKAYRHVLKKVTENKEVKSNVGK